MVCCAQIIISLITACMCFQFHQSQNLLIDQSQALLRSQSQAWYDTNNSLLKPRSCSLHGVSENSYRVNRVTKVSPSLSYWENSLPKPFQDSCSGCNFSMSSSRSFEFSLRCLLVTFAAGVFSEWLWMPHTIRLENHQRWRYCLIASSPLKIAEHKARP